MDQEFSTVTQAVATGTFETDIEFVAKQIYRLFLKSELSINDFGASFAMALFNKGFNEGMVAAENGLGT